MKTPVPKMVTAIFKPGPGAEPVPTAESGFGVDYSRHFWPEPESVGDGIGNTSPGFIFG